MCFKRRKENRDEFRTCFSRKAKGHPTYIYAKVGDRYKYIGLTHAEITKGMRNIPLEQNPNPNDSRQSFIRPKVDSDKESLFEKKAKDGWSLSKKDKRKVKKVIRSSKKKKTDR